jgi:hypothetical protein
MTVRCPLTLGSWCSIRSTPLCTAAATTGLSVEACRFNVHSPEKSGFCCAITVTDLEICAPDESAGRDHRDTRRSRDERARRPDFLHEYEDRYRRHPYEIITPTTKMKSQLQVS